MNRYFAYGSNLNTEDLDDFAERNGFRNSSRVTDGIFLLPDYELEFPVFSPSRKGGVLNVIPMIGHAVAGKIFEVDDWELLDAKEGSPNFYKKIQVNVIDENGNAFDAYTYVVNEERRKGFVSPNSEYVGIVSKGYKDFGIDEKFPFALENLHSSSGNRPCKRIECVFVYGTFRKGESRQSIMDNVSLDFSNEIIRGKMFNVGNYPAIVLQDGKIVGELHRIAEEGLKTLDGIEGFLGFNKDSLYLRVLVESGHGLCWTFVWNRATDNLKEIPSGDWLERDDA